MIFQTPYERSLELRHSRRQRDEDKTHARLVRLEEKAGRMVGELNSGKCYIWPIGGSYREGSRAELIAFLIRNRYV